jgi:hypothetical protein
MRDDGGDGMPGPHQPLRPPWICRCDAQPWPCADARLALSHEYADNRVTLCVYLGTSLAEAVRDLYVLNSAGAPEPALLANSFLDWVLRHPRT